MKNLTKILLSIYVAIMMVAVACKKEELTPTPPTTTPTTTPPVVTKSSTKDIAKFSFTALSPVVDATIDASTKAITATVPAATDLTKLVPTITISDKATISPATSVAQDFSKEVSYTVTAEDASMVVYKVNVKKDMLVATITDFIYRGGSSLDGLLNAFDATTGKKVWAFAPNNVGSNSNPCVSDGIVYIAGNDKNLYAVDAKTGVKIWEYSIYTDSYPVIVNGVLYCAEYNGKFFALDAKNGTKKWSIDLATSTPTSPVIVNNIVYTSTITTGTRGIVYALDAGTGQTKWKQESNVTGKDVCVANDLVFVKNGDFGITALDATTGTVKWKVGDSANSPQESAQTTLNDILYTATNSTGSIMAMDAKTGVRKWITQIDKTVNPLNTNSPIGADGLIYAVTDVTDAVCYALDAISGTIKWSASGFAYSRESPIVANNLVYLSRGIIDAKTGESKLKFPTTLSGRTQLALWIKGKTYHSAKSGEIQ